MRTVTHNTLYLTGASIIQKALSFIYFTLLARTFTADQIGAYSYSLAFTTIFAIIIDGGLTPVLIRRAARQPEHSRAFLKKILLCKLFLLALTLVIMTAAVVSIDAAFSTRSLILVAAVVMIADSMNLSIYGALRGHQNLTFESVGMVVAQLISLSAVIITVTGGFPIIYAIAGLGAGSIVNTGIALFGLSRVHDQTSGADEASGKFELRTVVHEAVPFALAGLFARGYSFLDLLLLGSFANFAVAGTYSIANKLTFVFQFVPLSLSAALYPAFSKMIGSSDIESSRSLWQSSERYLLIAAGLIILTLVSLRTQILGFFGAEHVGAAATLVLLAISLLFAFMSYPVGALLNAAGLQKLQTTAMACTLVVNASLNLLLIRSFGANGAAFSALIGNIVLFSVGAWFVHHRVMKLPWGALMRTGGLLLVCAVAGAGAIAGASTFISVGGQGILGQLTVIGTLAAVGAIIYCYMLLLTGVVRWVEILEFIGRLKKRV